MLTYEASVLSHLLDRAADMNAADGISFITEAECDTITYADLRTEARQVLGGLSEIGVRPGDRVMLLLEDPRNFVRSFWGCVLGGLVPCPMTPPRSDVDQWADHLGHVARLLGSSLLITTRHLRRTLPGVREAQVCCVEDLLAFPAGTSDFEPTRDDLALLMLTSGSTGTPKAVALTHGNLLASMSAKGERLAVASSDVGMNWIAFDHISAIESHLLPLRAGAAQIQVEPKLVLSDPSRFLQVIDANRVTMTFAPNFLFGQINRTPLDRTLDLSTVRHIISGGEATVRATATEFLDRLAPLGLARTSIVPAFGMTETSAGSVFSLEFPDVDAGSEFASLGSPVDGLEMRITDDDKPLSDGEVGELQVRGPMVFGGYFNDSAATAAAFTADGWFRTGDTGLIRDGRLTLTGRSKDSIIVNGVNYFSHDLETVLERLDDVEGSYVAAFPTRSPGEDTERLVVAFCPSGAPDETSLYRLICAVRDSVVLHWGFRPALILPLAKTDLPKTSLGKIQRSRIRARLEAGEFDPVIGSVAELSRRQLGEYVAPVDDAERVLTEIYATMFDIPVESVGTNTNFFDLGATSLDVLRLKHHVESRFDVSDFPVVQLLRAPTIHEQARLLRGDTGSPGAYHPLVTLQHSGEGTPLFCVHPGVGEVLVFVNLAKFFVKERPFHALRARGFGADEPYFSSFDEMVQSYVSAIRAEQPTGPYAVAGYSYGGAVAFEIAKALEALGERVDFVGVFNLPPHIKDRMDELDFTEGAVNLAFFLSLITREQAAQLPRQLRKSLPGRMLQLEYILGLAPAERLAELDLDLAKFASWVELAQSMVDLGRTYTPSGTVRSLTVFYAIPLRGTKEEWLRTQLRQWDDFSREPNRYVDVPGEHYTLMGSEHVPAFQAILRRELDLALSGRDR
ncbi:peptide synthetase [Actinosynnema sp. ALI-1.44]|uniref:non-ribosomal peptide synthetase n=1 Tax=Actinosynnema sp. ALI-1.44 TaxID=1933779 RepID=UPI00097BBCE9|nr:non-ribosomal peptide synthetase [Actinosynnema sp. ALI-1.44]ONI91989.1 peptide synthetase [Actinosynnema sp. ALI-1.44]